MQWPLHAELQVNGTELVLFFLWCNIYSAVTATPRGLVEVLKTLEFNLKVSGSKPHWGYLPRIFVSLSFLLSNSSLQFNTQWTLEVRGISGIWKKKKKGTTVTFSFPYELKNHSFGFMRIMVNCHASVSVSACRIFWVAIGQGICYVLRCLTSWYAWGGDIACSYN